jgi:putative ABC transport system permease protein
MTRAKRALDRLDDDIRDHIERETEDNIARGMTPAEARRQAMLKFGSVALATEDTRAAWGWQWLDQLLQDCRYAARALRRRPAYAFVSILTLALGIGGTASVYGVARGVLFEPLPYAHEREIGVFWKKTDWTHEEYLYVRGRVPGFQQVAQYRFRDMILRDGSAPARLVPGVAASAELFEVLGASPVLGRSFQHGEDIKGVEPVAVLSYGLWQELGGNPSTIGKRLVLDGTPRTVIGVMPRAFWFPDPAVRIWTSETLNPESKNPNSTLIGRVAPNLDVRTMQAPVARLTAMLNERFHYAAQFDKTKDARITPIGDELIGPMRPAVLATLGAMVLILLIGCANVAALVLGQVDARSTDLAVRAALGANRRRLIQQVAVEVAIIAIVAGAFGAAVARMGFTVVTRALPLDAWVDAAAPDWRVFTTAMAIAGAAALLVMLVPTISLHRADLRGVLDRTRTGGIEGRGGRLENSLVVAQVAFAVMIAAGAALLVRSVTNLYAVDDGVRTEGIAVVDVVFGTDLKRARREQTLDELTRELARLPGVRSVGLVQTLPLRGGGYRAPATFADRPATEENATEYRVATPGYLEILGMAARQGRTIAPTDRIDTERVVVINTALAEKYFAGVDPIGKLIGGDNDKPSRVVGVVTNAAETTLTDSAQPVRYVPVAQTGWIEDAHSLVLRASPGVDEASLLEPARQTVARVAPTVPVQQTTTMRRVLDTAIGPARQVVVLLSFLSALALTLSAVGVYGVVAHFATRRRRDWAIRMALGLPGSRVISQVVGHGAVLVAIGIGFGVAGAAVLARLLSSLLYDVNALDPLALAGAAAALFTVGTVSALIPAWRASSADPLRALREQ